MTNEVGRITGCYSYNVYDSLLEKDGDTENEFLYTGEQYNANPVMYTDPSGYATDKNLAETAVAATIAVMLASAVALHNQAMLNIFSSLRKNMTDAALSLQCTVTVTDWKNVIVGFPAHEFDTKWLITIPMALLSGQLFEVIYAIDEDTSNLPGVPAEEQEEDDEVESIPAEEKDGTEICQDNNKDKSSNKPYKNNKEANKQAQKQGYEDAHDLKEDYVGKGNASKFDMKYDTKTGEIYLESKNGKIQIPTGLKNK